MRLATLLRNNTASAMCRARPPKVVYSVEDLKNNKWVLPDPTKERGTKSHKSTGYANISKVSPIEVEGDFVRVFVGEI
jgi:hypothetical protein